VDLEERTYLFRLGLGLRLVWKKVDYFKNERIRGPDFGREGFKGRRIILILGPGRVYLGKQGKGRNLGREGTEFI